MDWSIIVSISLILAIGIVFIQFIVFWPIMKSLKKEVSDLKAENKDLTNTVNEFKQIVAIMIAESNSEDKDRVMKMAKQKLRPNALSLFKAGKMTMGLEALEMEVHENELDEVIALSSQFAGLTKSMEHKRISEEHFEREVNRIRQTAISMALETKKNGR